MALSPSDPSSFSRPEDCKIVAVDLDLNVDFKTHILNGSVTLDVEKATPETAKLTLDTRDLKVHKVCHGETELDFTLGKPEKSFGSKLEITLPSSDEIKFSVRIDYETSPQSTALQWLTPEQTAGKQQPYMFSQCQAIHARSLLPCQDTPAVKMPYKATIAVPSALVALMSAVKLTSEPHKDDATKSVHTFHQKVPIPSYLIAVVVGALESRKIGPRSTVWSEKEMVEEAAYEFAETEEMLSTAEKLMGEYVWGIYDLLVLPPSFPYGGMENPCLTFVTPTLLAGDRSLASVVAHEIAHSWTGNLVTNSNPEHFWLNEGHTKFVERKIEASVARGGEALRHLTSLEGWRALHNQVQVFGEEHPYTHLVPELKGVDPDDAFSTVPYEKGSNLLMYLEQKLGGVEAFEPFLPAYIERFKYKSITTDDWKAFLYEFFAEKKSLLDEVDWQTWFHKPGMPPVKPKYDTSLADACTALARRWAEAADDELGQLAKDDTKDFSSVQMKEFLSQLLEEKALSSAKIDRLEELFSFNAVKNSEIRFRWLRLCLKARVPAAVGRALDFVNEQGRLKFVRPIYRDLFHWEDSKVKAIENFEKHRCELHALTATMLGKDLGLIKG